MLPKDQIRSWARSLRSALLAWLASPYEPRHGCGGLSCQACRRYAPRRHGFWQTEQNESTRNNRRLTIMAALVPSVPEIRYLLARILLKPPLGQAFVIAWSLWRRTHQINAASAHYKNGIIRNCSTKPHFSGLQRFANRVVKAIHASGRDGGYGSLGFGGER